MICAFFFTHTPPTEIYTLSLHDALPILSRRVQRREAGPPHRWLSGWSTLRSKLSALSCLEALQLLAQDRKSTRLNSSHTVISYAVFCLKKKKIKKTIVPNNRSDSNPHRA